MSINPSSVKDNIDFILTHFDGQHELFPRTIMTAQTWGQKKLEHETEVQVSKDRVFDYFKQAGFTDCKINAFPYNTEHTKVDFDVKNKTAATFIMVDLDLRDFGSREKLDSQLKKTLNKLSLKFHGEANPTVLWTGNGYHIYQPIDGMVFEKHKVFYDFLPYLDKDLTTEFLRFAERFFTDGRSDPNHLPSIKSCLVRVPCTTNSKNGDEVKIVQKWDGKKPAIQWVNEDFRIHLIQKRIDKVREKGRLMQLQERAPLINVSNRIGWIENLLQTPLDDHRKFCLWRILCPYLVNVRKLPSEESTAILKEWLQKCDQLNKLNFNAQMETRHRLKHVGPFLPASKETLKKEHTGIYHIFRDKNIIIE